MADRSCVELSGTVGVLTALYALLPHRGSWQEAEVARINSAATGLLRKDSDRLKRL